MKSRTGVLLVVAIGCGLTAAFLTSQLVRPKEDRIEIVVASRDVPHGTIIQKADEYFKLQPLPKDAAPPAALTSLEQLNNKQVLRTLDAGQFCTQRDVGENDGLGRDIRPGHLALAVPVTVHSSVGGFVRPGAHVDLICSVPHPEDSRMKLSKIFMSDVHVLAINQDDRRDDKVKVVGNPVVATLEVTPEEAEKLNWLKDQGPVTMALRRADDKTKHETAGVVGPFTVPQKQTVEVPVARKRIDAGTRIDADNMAEYFEMKPQLRAALPQNTIVSLERLKDQTLRQVLVAGQVCTLEHLKTEVAPKGEPHRLAIFNGPLAPQVTEYPGLWVIAPK
ncbi:MAG: Flp pilus assembly protein CpaB [Gemmataceae bacterium]|nr:Flp pilus assembly protein CpaB [Gemmataceae bacterium]